MAADAYEVLISLKAHVKHNDELQTNGSEIWSL